MVVGSVGEKCGGCGLSIGEKCGGCGLYRGEVWWLWAL